MKSLSVVAMLLMLISVQTFAVEEIVVVVNINNPTTVMTKKQLIDLYMGKYVAFPNGMLANPLDLSQEPQTRAAFYQGLTGSTTSQINAYWSRIKFTGRASPPNKMTIDEVQQEVSTSVNVIAYLTREKAEATKNIKVIYKIDQQK